MVSIPLGTPVSFISLVWWKSESGDRSEKGNGSRLPQRVFFSAYSQFTDSGLLQVS